MNINKPVKILEYLMMGMEIKKDEHKYRLSKDNYLYEVMQKYEDDKYIEDVLVKVNFGSFYLNSFIKWANSFTDEEVFLIGCNKVLSDINQKKRL